MSRANPFQIVVVGGRESGKTAVVEKLLNGVCSKNINTRFDTYQYNLSANNRKTPVTMYDLDGYIPKQEKSWSLGENRGAVALVVLGATDDFTYNNIRSSLRFLNKKDNANEKINKTTIDLPVIFICNKIDLKSYAEKVNQQIKYITDLAKQFNLTQYGFVQTSAKVEGDHGVKLLRSELREKVKQTYYSGVNYNLDHAQKFRFQSLQTTTKSLSPQENNENIFVWLLLHYKSLDKFIGSIKYSIAIFFNDNNSVFKALVEKNNNSPGTKNQQIHAAFQKLLSENTLPEILETLFPESKTHNKFKSFFESSEFTLITNLLSLITKRETSLLTTPHSLAKKYSSRNQANSEINIIIKIAMRVYDNYFFSPKTELESSLHATLTNDLDNIPKEVDELICKYAPRQEKQTEPFFHIVL